MSKMHIGHAATAITTSVLFATSLLFLAPHAHAQEGRAAPGAAPAGPPRRVVTPNTTLVSPEVTPDRHVTFRIYAPNAKEVVVNSEIGQVLPFPAPTNMTRADNGVWSATLGPVLPGVYRYEFIVDGVETTDPKNLNVVSSLNGLFSAVTIPGAPFEDAREEVPHGGLSTVWYFSSVLAKQRRMHVYTPPGYTSGQQRYPVLYLMAVTNDDDDTWTSEGRANFILDNLIAAGKAKPMILVMSNGSVGPGFPPAEIRGLDLFNDEFMRDIIPYVEKNYRVAPGRANRAIAGPAVGGLQAINIGLMHMDQFAYIGVMSAGWQGEGTGEKFIREHEAAVDDVAPRKGLKLLWVAIGKQDSMAWQVSDHMVTLLKQHGLTPELYVDDNGHTWIGWRNYLVQFAPKLFQ